MASGPRQQSPTALRGGRTALRGGRRREATRETGVEEAILSATERLLEDQRLSDLTVADVIGAAGISRATFYFYFESKYAVLAALVERIIDEVYGAAEAWMQRGEQSPEEALRAAVGSSLALWRRHAAVLRATVEAQPAVPEIAALWRSRIARFIAASAAQIQREREAGLAPQEGPDPEALAAALISMNEHLFYLTLIGAIPDLADDDRLVETVATVWLRAVYAPGARPEG
jgi:AcrR family transcriptional regulator